MKYLIGQNGINLIKYYESCFLKAYQKIINGKKDLITIGWGHTGFINYEPIKLNQIISQQQADDILKSDISVFAIQISNMLKVLVTQNQFDAMVSLAYNIGINAFKDSSVLKFVNKKEFNEAAQSFLLWNKINHQPCEGLTKRRMAEKTLFLENKLVF